MSSIYRRVYSFKTKVAGNEFPPVGTTGYIAFYPDGSDYKCLVTGNFPDKSHWETAVFVETSPNVLEAIVNTDNIKVEFDPLADGSVNVTMSAGDDGGTGNGGGNGNDGG